MADAAQIPSSSPVVNPSDDLAQLTKDPTPSLVQEIAQFDQQHPQPAPQGSVHKEVEPVNTSPIPEQSKSVETAPALVEEIPTSVEVEKHAELQGYMEKIEKEAELSHPVTDDYTQKVLLSSSAPQNPVVTLPLTAVEAQQGLHHKVWEAITWLAVWCLRQVKLAPDRVKYKA